MGSASPAPHDANRDMHTLPRLIWSENDHEAARKRLAAHHVVTVALLESPTLDEALERILAGLGEVLGWDAGVLWKVDEPKSSFRAVSSWRPPSRGTSAIEPNSVRLPVEAAIGLAEHAGTRREPVWTTDVSREPLRDATIDRSIDKLSVAALRPIRSAVAFPAFSGRDVVAVFELLSSEVHPPNPQVGQTLASLGHQIGLYAERAAAREAFRVGEARKAAIVECALDCIVSIDREGRLTEFNPAAERTFGYPRAAVLGKPMASLLIAPSLRERHRRGFAHYVATGESAILGRRIETLAVRADGTEFPIELTVMLITSKDPPAFTAFIRDISEHARLVELEREAAERASASRRLLTAVIDCTPDAIFVKDLQGRYLLINSTGARGVGSSVNEVIGRTDAEIFAPETARDFRQVDEEVALTDTTKTSESVIPIDGRNRTYRAKTAPFRDENGEICGTIGVAVDVTESHRWQAALRESEERLRTLVEASPDDPVQLKDPSGRWLEANRAAVHLFGLEGVDFRNKTDAELSRIEGVYREAFQGCSRTDEVAWQRRERSRVEEAVPTREGPVRTFDVIKVPMFDADGARRALVILARDVSDRKLAEGERARLLEREREARLAAERAERRAGFLAEASRSLTTSLDHEGMLRLAADLAVPFLARVCLVCTAVDEGRPRECVVAPKDHPLAAALASTQVDPASRAGAPEALRTGRSFMGCEPVSARTLGLREDDSATVEGLAASSHMIVPLTARGKTCGTMTFLATDGARFSAADLELAEELGRRAAMAIDNARLYEDAQRAIRVRDDFLLVASHESSARPARP